MAIICPGITGPDSFAPGMLAFLDCQAQMLGSQGYQVLAAPASPVSLLITGMITLLIALMGYRMLLGQTPTLRDGVITVVKIGLVLALATNWTAYQILIYDVIFRSPAEFAAAIGGPAGLPGSTGGLAAHLDGVDQGLKALAIQGVGSPPPGPNGLPLMPNVAPPPFMQFDAFALGISRVSFLTGAIASFATVRIIAGLLLALGPLFLAFLLFDGTRGLFEGWLRALLGAALAALAISVVLGFELAVLEPWVGDLAARRETGLDIMGAPGQLLAATTVFAIALFAVSLAIGRVAFSLRLPSLHRPVLAISQSTTSLASTGSPALSPQGLTARTIEDRSRAQIVADAVALSQRRETGSVTAQTFPGASPSATFSIAARNDSGSLHLAPYSSTSRRTQLRTSARANQRDRNR
ncbi:type IV secretion system protein [Sphingobium fuliginis]|uniref:Type IV secretion system protein n=1 Tax=Sphingobium fuliginis ATCC 27551 TaxID=1208342 RepID=A0A5B8CEE2_SPHSA|nr:type IV secretion system protein [Sphingobium fuliginis]QDC36367.1 type IV secretion system protein [Sphingobium fuliginis ATCC 27551]